MKILLLVICSLVGLSFLSTSTAMQTINSVKPLSSYKAFDLEGGYEPGSILRVKKKKISSVVMDINQLKEQLPNKKLLDMKPPVPIPEEELDRTEIFKADLDVASAYKFFSENQKNNLKKVNNVVLHGKIVSRYYFENGTIVLTKLLNQLPKAELELILDEFNHNDGSKLIMVSEVKKYEQATELFDWGLQLGSETKAQIGQVFNIKGAANWDDKGRLKVTYNKGVLVGYKDIEIDKYYKKIIKDRIKVLTSQGNLTPLFKQVFYSSDFKHHNGDGEYPFHFDIPPSAKDTDAELGCVVKVSTGNGKEGRIRVRLATNDDPHFDLSPYNSGNGDFASGGIQKFRFAKGKTYSFSGTLKDQYLEVKELIVEVWAPSIPDEYRQKFANGKSGGSGGSPMAEKVAEYTALFTKIQGFPDKVEDYDKKEAQRNWIKCVDLCKEIFALIKADFPSRMQDIFVIKDQSDGPTEAPISKQMKRVQERMDERISHFDRSTFKHAKDEVKGWGEIAKEIMDKFQ